MGKAPRRREIKQQRYAHIKKRIDTRSSTERGYDHRWRKARKEYLQLNPLCVHCQEAGIAKAGTVVDHKEPHRGDKGLFWDVENWQTLCVRHHTIKTASGK